MHLVRYYAKHPVLPNFVTRMTLHDSPVPAPRVRAFVTHALHTPPAPVRATVDYHATVHGKALWWSGVTYWRRWARHIYKVEFAVDGNVLYTDNTWPYSFHRTVGWDTTTVSNGWHMLTVREFGTHHYRVVKHIPVHVVNPPLHVEVTGIVSNGAVAGNVVVGVHANGPVEAVALYVDGKPVSRDRSEPFDLYWNTHDDAEGPHTALVYARGPHGHRTALTVPVIVANNPTFPAALVRNWLTQANIEQ
jgi:hypothetical protein